MTLSNEGSMNFEKFKNDWMPFVKKIQKSKSTFLKQGCKKLHFRM